MIYICIIGGVVIIILAIGIGLFTLHNVNNMPYSLFGLNKENYEVIDKRQFNKFMVIGNTLVCIWFLLVGVLSIIFMESKVFTLLPLYILIDIIVSKVAKKYINIK